MVKRTRFLISDSYSRIAALARFPNPERQRCREFMSDYSDGHNYSYTDAQTDAHAQDCANSEASSYTAAETVV